jgi:hypothetical protein
MSNLQLAQGQLTPAAQLTIELIDAGTEHESVLITWPDKPTPVSPRRYDEIAAQATRILSNAGVELARIEAAGTR